MSSVSQREQVKRWFKKHPNYYREWTARTKAAKRADRAADAARTKVKPPVVNGRITYAINVTNPLTEEERSEVNNPEPIDRQTETCTRDHAEATDLSNLRAMP